MSAAAGPKHAVIKAEGFVKQGQVTRAEAKKAKELFRQQLNKCNVKFRNANGQEIACLSKGDLEDNWDSLQVCCMGRGDQSMQSEKTGKGDVRVDNEYDLTAAFQSPSGKQAWSGKWMRWDAQRDKDSLGSIMIPCNHWVPLSNLPDLLASATFENKRYAVWQPNADNTVTIMGSNIQVDPNQDPITIPNEPVKEAPSNKKGKK